MQREGGPVGPPSLCHPAGASGASCPSLSSRRSERSERVSGSTVLTQRSVHRVSHSTRKEETILKADPSELSDEAGWEKRRCGASDKSFSHNVMTISVGAVYFSSWPPFFQLLSSRQTSSHQTSSPPAASWQPS